MKKRIFTLVLLLSYLIITEIQAQKRESPSGRVQWEYEITADPKTGLIPRDELENSREIMSKVIDEMAKNRINGVIPNVEWNERGPNNVGGRVRALMFDPNDSGNGYKKVWAGGVSGGLWFNSDITNATTSWTKVSDFWDNIAISCIAYDPGDSQIFYVGTGELNNSTPGNDGVSGTGGGGIWKTTDGGATWARLASTIPDYSGAASAQQISFRVVNRIAVNAAGRVFAATQQGLLASADGGATWAYVAGATKPADNAFINDVEIASDNIVYVGVGGENTFNDVYKSTSDAATNWAQITYAPGGQPTDGNRTEIALAPSTAGASQVIYVAVAGPAATDYFVKSTDAGANWTLITEPKQGGGTNPSFMGEQGFYDLILGVKPDNPNVLYAGAITSAISVTGGTSWQNEFTYDWQNTNFFVDNHGFAARPGIGNESAAIFGNDGGVYYSANWSANPGTFSKRVKGLNITQFYSVAQKAASGDPYVMGGAQDNGNQVVIGSEGYGNIGAAFEIQEGDGGMNFIDADDPAIQIVSYTNSSFTLYDNGNKNVSLNLTPQGGNTNGTFINAAAYNSATNTLYSNFTISGEANTTIQRHVINGSSGSYTQTPNKLTLTGAGALEVSFIKLGKTAGTIFIGTKQGDIYRATGIPAGDASVALTKIMDKATFGQGFVSSIDIGANDNTLIVTRGNYNIKSVYYSTNGGAAWTSKNEATHGLPNMPIRYALINPQNMNQVLLATELGVWSTDDITAANPQWSATNEKLAHVRCDMLVYRASDNTVAVGTHGRGFFTAKLNQTNCPNTLVLINPTNNVNAGTSTYTAGQTINASNIISGASTNVTYTAGNSITLAPNGGNGTTFEAQNGTVFHAYISGCP